MILTNNVQLKEMGRTSWISAVRTRRVDLKRSSAWMSQLLKACTDPVRCKEIGHYMEIRKSKAPSAARVKTSNSRVVNPYSKMEYRN